MIGLSVNDFSVPGLSDFSYTEQTEKRDEQEPKVGGIPMWEMVLYTLVTGGIYGFFWLGRRTAELNRISDHPVRELFVVVETIALVALFSSALALFCLFTQSYVDPDYLRKILVVFNASLSCSFVLTGSWLFLVHNKIQVCAVRNGKAVRLNKMMTFVGGIFYLNYQLNRCFED